MRLHIFLYIISNLFLLQLNSLESASVDSVVNIICVISIATLGIAHGAIDNILHGANKGMSKFFFILKYLLIMLLFAIFWFVTPNLAFLVFLILSAYHFGQTQLVDYKISSKLVSGFMYFLWGGIVILLMLFFNKEHLMELRGAEYNLPEVYFHLVTHSQAYLLSFAGLLVAIFAKIRIDGAISNSALFKETYLMALITCSFLLMEPFIAFALFFVLVHSLKAISQEFTFCKEKLIIQNTVQFFLLFLPLTISSLVGISVVLLLVVQFSHLSLIPYTLLVLLSCITIPHSFVMNRFYNFV
ncbi:MAG: Brp/Blh family beta-carotene 15,15'-dioxygenase [Bacteroidota bacterium]